MTMTDTELARIRRQLDVTILVSPLPVVSRQRYVHDVTTLLAHIDVLEMALADARRVWGRGNQAHDEWLDTDARAER